MAKTVISYITADICYKLCLKKSWTTDKFSNNYNNSGSI